MFRSLNMVVAVPVFLLGLPGVTAVGQDDAQKHHGVSCFDQSRVDEQLWNNMLRNGKAAARGYLKRLIHDSPESCPVDMVQEALLLLEPAVDMMDPFGCIAYTLDYDQISTGFLPNGSSGPVAPVIDRLTELSKEEPTRCRVIADTVWFACVAQLMETVASGGSVIVADDVLYSKKIAHSNAPTPLAGESRVRLRNGPRRQMSDAREWFLIREVYNAKNVPYFCSGLWLDAFRFAVRCDPDSQKRWEPTMRRIIADLTDDGRYASAAFILDFVGGGNVFEFLEAQGDTFWTCEYVHRPRPRCERRPTWRLPLPITARLWRSGINPLQRPAQSREARSSRSAGN